MTKAVPLDARAAPFPLVGIIDSGIEPCNPVLEACLRLGRNQAKGPLPVPTRDQDGHGTAVASALALSALHTRALAPIVCQSPMQYVGTLPDCIRQAALAASLAGARHVILSASYRVPDDTAAAHETTAWQRTLLHLAIQGTTLYCSVPHGPPTYPSAALLHTDSPAFCGISHLPVQAPTSRALRYCTPTPHPYFRLDGTVGHDSSISLAVPALVPHLITRTEASSWTC